jgi:hypothetical protein
MERITHTTYSWPLPGNRKFLYTGDELDALFIDAAFGDAERYRKLRRGQHWSVVDGVGKTLRGVALDVALDAAPAAIQPPNATAHLPASGRSGAARG